MRKGDIVLVSYKIDPIGLLIKKVTDCEYNHVCLAINNNTVLDIKATQIKFCKLKKYRDEDLYDIKILRMKSISDEKIDKIIQYLMRQKYKRNYLKWLYQGIKYIITKKPFKPTCSGLIGEAFHSVGYYFGLATNPCYIMPKDILERRLMIDVTEEEYENK